MTINPGTAEGQPAEIARSLRFMLMDPAGNPLAPDAYNHYHGIENIDTRDSHSVSAQILCDLDHWHEIGRTPLPPWKP